MKISKIHQSFSDHLGEPKVLTNPEDYLGPNWEDVINFWLYVDTLTKEEREKMSDSYWDLDYDVLDSAENAAWDSSEEVVGEEVANMAWNAALDVTDYSVFGFVTDELLASHKLLEQNKTLVALPLCINQ
jgi:hypothetical protein